MATKIEREQAGEHSKTLRLKKEDLGLLLGALGALQALGLKTLIAAGLLAMFVLGRITR